MEKFLYDYFYKIEDKHWWFQGRKEILLRLIDKYYRPEPNSKVLDIGCGTGMMLKSLSKYGEVYGLDKNEKAIAYSKIRSPKAKIVLGSFPENMQNLLPLKFDLITVLDVLEHIDDDTKALEAIKNILKPNGILIITVPAYKFLWTHFDEVNQHKRRYTRRELSEKITKAGFKIEKISYFDTFPFAPAVVVKFLEHIFSRSEKNNQLGLQMSLHSFNRFFKWLFSSEKHFLTNINFPFGISIVAIAALD